MVEALDYDGQYTEGCAHSLREVERASWGGCVGTTAQPPWRYIAMARLHEEAFLRAFDQYADALFRHASFGLSNRERAQDLTQETFIKAWDYIRSGKEIENWKSFLYRVMNNLIIDEYRRRKSVSLDALMEENSLHANALVSTGSRREREEEFDGELLTGRVRTLMQTMLPRERTLLTLRYVEGRSPKEIAASLGISENAVSVRIHRAVERLRKLCAPLFTL